MVISTHSTPERLDKLSLDSIDLSSEISELKYSVDNLDKTIDNLEIESKPTNILNDPPTAFEAILNLYSTGYLSENRKSAIDKMFGIPTRVESAAEEEKEYATDCRLVLESGNSSKRTKKDELIFDTDVTYIGGEVSQRNNPPKLISTKAVEDWWTTKQFNTKSTYKNACEVCQGKRKVEDFSGVERFCFMCSEHNKERTAEIIKKKWYEFVISKLKEFLSLLKSH